MKIYLLIVSLLVAQNLAYRYASTQGLQLSSLPQTMFYVAPNVFAGQNGKTIYLYDTVTNYVQQTFQSDTDNPQLQVAGQLNLVLFKNNKSIFQLQPHDGPLTINQAEPTNQWVYPLGLANKTIVYHSLDPIVADRWITYAEYLSEYEYQVYVSEFMNPNQNILRGSGVNLINPNEYYFVSGGICNNQSQVLFFFRGSKQEINNVFNLSVPGCNMPKSAKKQTIGLVSADLGNQYRLHAVTFKLNVENEPFLFTTQVLYQFQGLIQEWISFDTLKLIGIDYVGTNLYTADEELCRVLQHQPDAYKKAQIYPSVLPAVILDYAISYQNFQIAVFQGTNDFSIFTYEEGTGKILFSKNIIGLAGASFSNGEYYGGNLWIVRDSKTSNISTVYLSADGSTSNIKDMGYKVVDYCSTKNEIIYTAQFDGNKYKLNHDVIIFPGDPTSSLRTIQTSFSINLAGTVKSLDCLDGDTIVVYPINEGEPITTWQSDGTKFSQTGILTKNNTLHSQIHTTSSSIIFLNSNKQSILVYDQRLKLVSNSLQPLLPPGAGYDIAATVGNNVIFAIAGRADFNQPDSLDHYTLIGSTLNYIGSYPLYGVNQVSFRKIILLANIGRLSIDYGSQSVSYEVNYPPQSLRGYFYDLVDQDCRGYNFAKFKENSIPDSFDMIVINSINTFPSIQRYTFSQKASGLLPKVSSSTLNNYLYSQMSVEFSADRQKVLVYGVKQTTTGNMRTVQVKNSNNLDTLFQKEFFDITVNKQLQAYGLNNADFISVVQYQFDFIQAHFNMLDLNIDIASQGKISIDSSIVSVDLFATCSKCSYTAVAAYKSKLIQLLSLTNNVNRGNITVSCNLVQLALSADGSRIAYLCQNNRLYVYDNIVDQTYPLVSNYTQITNFYFVSQDYIVFINDGLVYQLKIGRNQTSKLLDYFKLIYKSLNTVPVQTIAINNNLQLYAYISDAQTVSILDKQGNSAGVFVLNDANQTIKNIAFDPWNQLIVTTDAKNLITLSPTDCPSNSTINSSTGYCACNPTFAFANDTCMCSSPLYLDGDSCICEDGNYYVNETQCAECNVMCHTCQGEGVSNCIKYSALFIIIIVVIVLIVVGSFIFCYFKSKKGDTKLQSIQKSASNKKKSMSSDNIAERLVYKNEEEKMKLQI